MKSPAGFVPGSKSGWHHAVLDEGVQRVKKDNKDMKARLAQLEDLVSSLTENGNKKGKKNGN